MNKAVLFVKRTLSGWWRVLRALLLAAGVVAAAGAVATAVVVPLWYAATNFRAVYTVVSLSAIAAAIPVTVALVVLTGYAFSSNRSANR